MANKFSFSSCAIIAFLGMLCPDFVSTAPGVRVVDHIGEKQNIYHVSFDDTINIFKDISGRRYRSIFCNPLLSYLRYLHVRYGTVFSFYCFYEDCEGFDLSSVGSMYADEFAENSSWLRFAYHSRFAGYEPKDAGDFLASYNMTMGELARITGNSLDSNTRLHCYKGSKNEIQAVKKEGVFPIRGLFTSDRNAASYDLSPGDVGLLCDCDCVERSGMNYYKTDVRIEELPHELDVKSVTGNKWGGVIIVFTHEWAFSGENLGKMEQLIKLFTAMGYKPDFPENSSR